MRQSPATPQARSAPGVRRTAPPPPLSPPSPATTQVTVPATPKTLTMQDVVDLRAQREELSNQLSSAQGRRNQIASQLRDNRLQGQARTGLEQRLTVLDDRIARLEQDIDRVGQQLVRAPGEFIAGTAPASGSGRGPSPGQTTAISIVFTVGVLAPIAFAYARGLLRRMSRPVALPESRETNARLENLERGLEAVAIEIERMSEGQRFVTKLLSEGAARPIEVNQRAAQALRASLPDQR